MIRLQHFFIVLISSLFFTACDHSKIFQEHDQALSEVKHWSAKAIYQKAEEERKIDNHHEAIRTYIVLNSLHPSNEYAEISQLRLMQCYYDMKDIDENVLEKVTRIADKFMLLYPKSQYLEEIWYLKIKILLHHYLSKSSFWKFFNQDPSERDRTNIHLPMNECYVFLKRFSSGKYVRKIHKKLDKIINQRANYEYHIANFNYKKRAYLAAMKRATAVMQDYPKTPAAKKAKTLVKMVKEVINDI